VDDLAQANVNNYSNTKYLEDATCAIIPLTSEGSSSTTSIAEESKINSFSPSCSLSPKSKRRRPITTSSKSNSYGWSDKHSISQGYHRVSCCDESLETDRERWRVRRKKAGDVRSSCEWLSQLSFPSHLQTIHCISVAKLS
jgi:hypothetical protein